MIPDFILARLADDEADADRWHWDQCSWFTPPVKGAQIRWDGVKRNACSCVGPAQVRARCDALRLMADMIFREWGRHIETHDLYETGLLELAALWADHPDYDPAWWPSRLTDDDGNRITADQL